MADTILRVFDSFDVAQQARSLLLDAGFPPEALEMRPQEDDGGPVQGNFVVDLEDKPTPPRSSASRQSAQSELRTPRQRNTCLLLVAVQDARQRQQAETLLARAARADHADRIDSRPDSA